MDLDQIVNDLTEIAGTSIVVSKNDIVDRQPPVPQAGGRQPVRGANRFAPLSNFNRSIRLAIQAIETLRVTTGIAMNVCGPYPNLTLPAGNLGTALAAGDGTLSTFFGRRGVKGQAGTTVVELEKNGVPTGKTLTWDAATDADFALKTISINIKVKLGDRLSLRVTSAEAAAEDLFCAVAP